MGDASKTGPGLQHRLDSARDYELLDVNIFLKGEPARELAMETLATDEPKAPRGRKHFLSKLRSRAMEHQQKLLDFLSKASRSEGFTDDFISVPAAGTVVESFWINNALGAQVTRRVLKDILNRSDVAFVEVERHVSIEELLDAKSKRATAIKKKVASRGGKAKKATKKVPAPTPNVAWSVAHINAPLLWQMGITGKGIVVALIDTGVNYKHPDLSTNMWAGGPAFPNHGYDYENDDDDPMDGNGHGTAAAGQVAGNGSAGLRTGVAPEAAIMAIRVGGAERNFWKAMQFALDQGADVISMSMSWKYPSSPDYPAWRRTCESILAAGVLHANSIGNQGTDLVRFPIPFNIATPGNCPPPRLHPLQSIVGGLASPIGCGATDDLDRLADYSGRGPAAWEAGPFVDYPYEGGQRQQDHRQLRRIDLEGVASQRQGLIKPDICAPGPGTTSCNWQFFSNDPSARPYVPFGGTSAATPHVGGCLALLAHACRRAGQLVVPAQIQEALENTAVRVVGQTLDKENDYGAGRVDVYAAYQYGRTRGWWH